MVKRHGAGKQKKLAKQKARRSEKRSRLLQLNSKDPTVRLLRAEKWPVVHALVGAKLWKDGIGYLVIARQEVEGRLIFGVYLVDVYCLGVKNAFWSVGTPGEFKELIQKMGKTQTMIPISPACLVKILEGAVEYARSFSFPPHPDYRHAAMLLAGIDPKACARIHVRPRRQAFLYPRTQRVVRTGQRHHATNPGVRRTLHHSGIRCWSGRVGRLRGWG